MQFSFYTHRLSLSLITDSDYAFTRVLVNTPGWLRFIGDRQVHSDEDAVNYIRKIRSTPDLYYWVVRLKETQQPVGIISFLKRTYLDHFDLGFAFLPQYSGQGLALEASAAVLEQVAATGKHKVVQAVSMPANTKSIKLLEKLGMIFSHEIVNNNEQLQVYILKFSSPSTGTQQE